MSIQIEIRELSPEETDGAAALLGRALRDNPLHVGAFGLDPEERERRLTATFTSVLHHHRSKGAILGAFRQERLAGVCAFVAPHRCPASAREKLMLVPNVVEGMGIRGTARLVRWVAAWSRHDPAEAHWHLGPVGVERDLQGQGVGSLLLDEFCRRMDASGGAAYLETDKRENVSFYQRFGFQLLAEDLVLGVPNWFMIRRRG